MSKKRVAVKLEIRVALIMDIDADARHAIDELYIDIKPGDKSVMVVDDEITDAEILSATVTQ